MGKQKKSIRELDDLLAYCVCAEMRPASCDCELSVRRCRRLHLNVGDRRLAVAARTASETEKRSHELPSAELASRDRNLERPAVEGKGGRPYARK